MLILCYSFIKNLYLYCYNALHVHVGCVTLCYSVLPYDMLCYSVLPYDMLCYSVLPYDMLCYSVLPYVVLQCTGKMLCTLSWGKPEQVADQANFIPYTYNHVFLTNSLTSQTHCLACVTT